MLWDQKISLKFSTSSFPTVQLEAAETSLTGLLITAINDIQSELTVDIRLFSCGKKFTTVGRSENLQTLMSHQSVHPVPEEVSSELQFSDKLLYIYTSGTTGLPKAAVVKNSR